MEQDSYSVPEVIEVISDEEFNLSSMINEIETLYEKCMH